LPFDNRIKVRANGPLLCTGEVEVLGPDGQLLEEAADVALCRCGHSGNKPFCDGSHREAGFVHDGMLASVSSDESETAGGPLQISVRENAMLVAKGPMTIVDADGRLIATRNKAALCRCGHSGNKPFCDGSHKHVGFVG
jgi:CDGSH-type Zn-finger protein